MSTSSRRGFLKGSSIAAAGSAIALSHTTAKAAPSERVRVGVMGGGGRASSLISSFAGNKAVEVVAVADLDPGRLQSGLKIAEDRQKKRPRGESDFRKLITRSESRSPRSS